MGCGFPFKCFYKRYCLRSRREVFKNNPRRTVAALSGVVGTVLCSSLLSHDSLSAVWLKEAAFYIIGKFVQ